MNELESMQHAAALAAADVVAAAGDDVSLASRAAQGDQAAFSRIMRRYNQRLYRLAVSVLGDASEAEDVLQESYVRAFYSFASYAGTGSLGAWLARIVRNEAIDRVRARESRRSHVAIEADLGVLSGEDDTNVGDDLTRAPSARLDLHAVPRRPSRNSPAAADGSWNGRWRPANTSCLRIGASRDAALRRPNGYCP